MRFIYFLFVLILFGACDSTTPEQGRWKAHVRNTQIIRDDFGVPHIYGKTDADAVFGMLYAQCEDDFKRVERNYIVATGRLAEVEGEELLYSDVRANLFMTKEEAIAYYDKSPDWLKKLCVAFADGINYYLDTHPEVKPELITHFEPWMPMYFSEGSIGGDIESISLRKIKAFYEKKKLTYVDEPAFEKSQGSNGFAISGVLTESGNAMLLINPHTSFYFRGEIHVVSEEGLNAYGAVTWGQFFVYQGFNENNGWMHTSSYADVMDEFIEEIIEQDNQLMYKYHDGLLAVQQKEITLTYKSDENLKTKIFPIYRTHHGPVTQEQDGKWITTAMMWSPSEALQQAFIRTKTNSYEEFRRMMDIRTNSSNNTVYADADGNIAYFHGNFMPKRNVKFDYSKPVDGSNMDTDWHGLHDVKEIIQLLNPGNGWIQNCNSTPFTAAGEYSPKPEDYPYYMATEAENFRGVHAIKILSGSNGYTLDKLIDVAYDPYLPGFEKIISGLVEAYDKSGKDYPALNPAIEVLRNWDRKVSKESVGMSLAHFYTTLFDQTYPDTDSLTFMERIDFLGTGSSQLGRIDMFEKAVNKLTEDFGRWDVPWGEICRFQRLDGTINQKFDDLKPSIPVGMASASWGALASYRQRGVSDTKRIYGGHGNSFVAVVEFSEKVRAKSLLAGGQSGDPQSPHFFDQGQRYADAQFKDVAFYKEDVEKRATRVYKPGE